MVAVFVLDRNKRCRFINAVAEFLTGIPLSQAAGRPFADLIWRGEAEAFEETHLARALGSKQPEEGEVTLAVNERADHPFAFRVVPIDLDQSEGKVVELIDLGGETGTARALRESERRLRLATESTGIGIWDVNAVTGQRRWSAEFIAILGLPPGTEASSDLFLSLVHPDDREWLDTLYRRAYERQTQNPYSAEFRIRRANDHAERWVVATGLITFDAKGRALRGVGTLRDIHERHEHETAIRESQERLRIALVAGRMGLWRYDFRTGTQEWDATQYQILGVDPSLPASRERFMSLVHPDDVGNVEFDLATLPAGTFLDSEFRILRPDGKIRWLTAHAIVRHDDRGTPIEMVGVNRDVTEQKEAALTLQVSEERHRLAVEANEIGTWDLDLTTGERRWSPQYKRLWGLPEDAPDDPELLRPLVDPADWEAVQTAWADAIDPKKGSGRLAVEYQIRRADTGERRWCSFAGNIFFDAAQARPLRAIGIMMDTTARKAVEERRRRVLKELHHRVNNNLAVVQAILLQTARSTKPKDAFERIQSRLMCLARVHELLGRSDWGEVPLRTLLSSEIEFAGGVAERVVLRGEPFLLDSTAAATLGLVFHELASNAAHHGAMSVPGGRVAVSWRRAAEPKPQLDIVWEELGLKGIRGPSREGFGFRVIRSSVAGNLDGNAEVAFNPTGVRWDLAFPLRSPVSDLTGDSIPANAEAGNLR